jgi:small subunit ribosomal protein S9
MADDDDRNAGEQSQGAAGDESQQDAQGAEDAPGAEDAQAAEAQDAEAQGAEPQDAGGDSAQGDGGDQGAAPSEEEQLPVPTAEAQEVATAAEDAAPQVAKEDAAKASAGDAPQAQSEAGPDGEEGEAEEPGARALAGKPSVPGAHLEVDIVPEGVDPLSRGAQEEEYVDPYAIVEAEGEIVPAEEAEAEPEPEEPLSEPIATAAIDLAASARYRATGKRKTAIARVTLRPGSGTYVINGRSLEEHFPRATLQRNIRQPLETVGYHERMDVVARLHGGGISAQAGALRHGVSRALLEADPNLRGELKRRGFLTRDSRAKERKKAGLKKARKRPQFSKR